MADSTTKLYFEISNGEFVQSDSAPNRVSPPYFTAGDTRALLLKLVRRTAPDSVEVIDLAGITVKLGLGAPAATPTVFTSATSSGQDANGFLPISLDLTVAGIQTALGTLASVECVMELKIIGSSDPQRRSLTTYLVQRLLT